MCNQCSIRVYYVQFMDENNKPMLPIPPHESSNYCTVLKQMEENNYFNSPFRNLVNNHENFVYISDIVYSRYFMSSNSIIIPGILIIEKLPAFIKKDTEKYNNLRWSLHLRWLLLAFRDFRHPLHGQSDILKEIAGFL